MFEDYRALEVVGESERPASDPNVLEPDPTCVRHHHELSEANHGVVDLRRQSVGFAVHLSHGFPCESAEEDSLDRVLVDLEHVWVLEDEHADLVALEADPASEEVEPSDRESFVGLAEDYLLEFQDFSDPLLDFHAIVEAMVSDSLELLGKRFYFRFCE